MRDGKSPSIARMAPSTMIHIREAGKVGIVPRGETGRLAAECAVVEIESVTVCGVAPGVIVAEGENVADVPAGKGGAAVNVTGLANVPYEGDTINAKLAVCPAVTGGKELGGLTA